MALNHCLLLSVVLLNSFCVQVYTSNVFTAIAHLQNAFDSESLLVSHINDYIQSERDRLNHLQRLSEKMRTHRDNMISGNLERHLSNPLAAYAVIKDMYDMMHNMDQQISAAITNKEDFSNASSEAQLFMPKLSDVEGAVHAIIRLQDTYEIQTEILAQNQLAHNSDEQLSSPLTGDQCMEVGKITYYEQDYFHAVPWLVASLKAYKVEGAASEILTSTLDFLSFSLYKQGDVKNALNYTKQMLAYTPDHERALNNKKYFESMLEEGGEQIIHNNRIRNGYHITEDFNHYEKLCRGERTVEIKNEHTLKCRYVTHDNPQLILSPAKEEELVHSPRLVFFHDVLNDREVNIIKSAANPLLERSGLFAPDKLTGPAGGVKSDTRVSKSAWLYDLDYPEVEVISRRVGAIANLDLKHAEAFQVLNYGIGGHYEPHVDFARAGNKNAFKEVDGNRIATFLVYLTDVERGGATVFPILGATVWPEKGGAAFWYNMKTDGTPDETTLHGACPVLLGYKWVSNKWFHTSGNEFLRPCELQPPS